jgi:hypothetical protein
MYPRHITPYFSLQFVKLTIEEKIFRLGNI